MKDTHKNAIEEYQCSGCVCGSNTTCFKPDDDGVGCGKNVPGTTVFPTGRIFLGMPTGFNRLGYQKELRIKIFDSISKDDGGWGFGQYGYGAFNVPVWKYLDPHGNTLVRGISPRINNPFLHIYLSDQREDIDCLEINDADLAEMD